VHDALDDKRFSADILIQQQQIRSVFCLPIAGNTGLRGLVYLENSIAAGAFSEQQIQAVRLLSGQMAISLDNALLNEQLEQRVEERTRQLRSQQQILLEKNQELQTLNAEKDELLSIVAHDLRNPLRQIKNMLGQVLLKGDSASDQKEYIELSLKAAERLQQMISQIIRIDALDMQKITLELETVDMELLLEEALAGIQLQAAEKELVLEVLLPDEPFELELDRRYCLRVLNILLSNALTYSPYGSKIYVSLFADDGQLTIEIRDEGPGISQKEQKRLFSKFQVLHQPIEEGDGFSGLSLAQAKQYVEAMGGKLGCSSELGEGSVFYLIFPFH
jgi:signal transduction histidine kinase